MHYNIGKHKWWSPTTGGDPIDLAYVDGGLYDNLGALAVLRRGCSTLLLCDACDTDLTDKKQCPNEEKIKEKYSDLGFLFGVGAPSLPKFITKKSYSDTINERSQVFESEEFMNVINEMKYKQSHGKPLVVRKKLKLLANEYAGIYESREVDVIFCFNGANKKFEEKLKIPKTAKIDKGRFAPFPYINTLLCDYTGDEVNMLSSSCSYNLVEGLKSVDFDIDQVERLSP